jgi:hypothetical protein
VRCQSKDFTEFVNSVKNKLGISRKLKKPNEKGLGAKVDIMSMSKKRCLTFQIYSLSLGWIRQNSHIIRKCPGFTIFFFVTNCQSPFAIIAHSQRLTCNKRFPWAKCVYDAIWIMAWIKLPWAINII